MKKYKLKYNYSFIPLPIALMLLLTGCTFQSNDVSHIVQYSGSRFWLAQKFKKWIFSTVFYKSSHPILC